MIKQSDIKLFEMTFGDLSPLTPMQRIDLMEWYFGCTEKSIKNIDVKSVEFRVINVLSRIGASTTAVIRNRLRSKLSDAEMKVLLDRMVNDGRLAKTKSKTGKEFYSIARGKK